MKKSIIYTIVLLLFAVCLSSCHRSTYEVGFTIDQGTKRDTVNCTVSLSERILFVGEDSHFDIQHSPYKSYSGNLSSDCIEYYACFESHLGACCPLYKGPYPVTVLYIKFIK